MAIPKKSVLLLSSTWKGKPAVSSAGVPLASGVPLQSGLSWIRTAVAPGALPVRRGLLSFARAPGRMLSSGTLGGVESSR